ncbi:MAG: 1-deoxy-D-xylulose-5-phosphate synthase, partial [Oscillospiraceae bacterium]|nr:1-deoxy-D-xylulose-5-phosphate synthase [Oscillospiraceae bacterium]
MEQQWIEQIPEIEELKIMPAGELEELCGLLRQILIHTVSKTGGHLSANLGVVELTVALHQVFDLYEDSAERNDDANGNTGIVFDGDPPDNVIWDVGHQCYIHKLLTGRGARFHTLRQEHGLSGFPDPGEHPSDTFVVGHASSSISAANGIAKAKTLTGKEGYTIAVIGDGAMTGGLAYEGLCNAGRSSDRLIVILNDNRMSISQNVGFIARYLAKLRSQRKYLRFKKMVNRVSNHIPLIGPALFRLMAGFKTRLKKTVYSKSSMFEEMGFYY